MNEMLLGRRDLLADLCGGREARPRRSASTPAAPTAMRRSASGWPAHRVEDYVAQSAAFESQLLSFLAEGVFQKFTALKLVLIESGFTWLPNLLWRTSKGWRGMRAETPWIDRPPAEIVREHVRVTLQPVDAPKGDAKTLDAGAGAHRFRPDAAVLDRLSALAVRRRGCAAGRAAGRSCEANPDRQCARNLSAFARRGGRSAIMHHPEGVPSDEHSGSARHRGNQARDRRLRHPSGVPQAVGPLSVHGVALARAHDDVRRASAPGLVRATAMAAHDGGRHAASMRFRRKARPAPIST